MTTPQELMQLSQFLLPAIQSGDQATIEQLVNLLASKGDVNPQQFLSTIQAGNTGASGFAPQGGQPPTLDPNVIANPLPMVQAPQPPPQIPQEATPPINPQGEEGAQDGVNKILANLIEASRGFQPTAPPEVKPPPASNPGTPSAPGTGLGGQGMDINTLLGLGRRDPGFGGQYGFGRLLLGQR